MKKYFILLLCLYGYWAANGQVTKSEHFLGGSIGLTKQGDFTTFNLIPEYRFAVSDKDLIGLSVGILRTSNNAVDNSVFVVRPNYTRIFTIEGNFFWYLNGFLDLNFGDTQRVAPGIASGLGYRVHRSTMLVLRGGFISYDFEGKAFNAGLAPSTLGLSAYFRIGGG